jgi:hypothetical protein
MTKIFQADAAPRTNFFADAFTVAVLALTGILGLLTIATA